jgi:uncharacterized protein YkwD
MRALHRALGTVLVSSLAVLALAGCDPVDAPELATASGGLPGTSRSTSSTTAPTTTPTTTPSPTTSTTPPGTGTADATPSSTPSSTTDSPPTTTRSVEAPPSSSTAPTSAPTTTPPTTSTTPPTTTSTTTSRPAPPAPTGAAAEVLDLVNTERARAGCDPVRLDDRLTEAAVRHSRDMAENDFVKHVGSDGSTFDQRIRDAGYPSPRSENIAAGQRTAADVVRSWMSSSGHRRNILDCSAADMGLGRAESDSRFGVHWTQTFGRG